jgi:CTP synthase (UTP-ammonia lyase)
LKENVRIGNIADYNAASKYHKATSDSIAHAADALQMRAEPVWLDTESLDAADAEERLESCDALWGGTGSPYRSMEGALRGIRFARERGKPFVGT